MAYTYNGPDRVGPELETRTADVEQMRKDLRMATVLAKVLTSKITTATRKTDALKAKLTAENDELNETRRMLERHRAKEARTIAAARDEAARITAQAATDAQRIIADAERQSALVREKARQQARALLDGEYSNAYERARDEATAKKSTLAHLRKIA